MYITNSCKKSTPNHSIIYVSSDSSKSPTTIIYMLRTTVEINPDIELMKPASGFLKLFIYRPSNIGTKVLDISIEDRNTQRPSICLKITATPKPKTHDNRMPYRVVLISSATVASGFIAGL